MEPSNENSIKKMQLIMDVNSITLHASLMPGVLTTQTFEGTDCYAKFINCMKQISAEKGSPTLVEIIVR